jgi:hypothetical protein
MLTTAVARKKIHADYFWNVGGSYTNIPNRNQLNSPFPLLRFRSTFHCGYSGITDKDSGPARMQILNANIFANILLLAMAHLTLAF